MDAVPCRDSGIHLKQLETVLESVAIGYVNDAIDQLAFADLITINILRSSVSDPSGFYAAGVDNTRQQ